MNQADEDDNERSGENERSGSSNSNSNDVDEDLKLFNSVQSEELQHAATLNARVKEAEMMREQVEAEIKREQAQFI